MQKWVKLESSNFIEVKFKHRNNQLMPETGHYRFAKMTGGISNIRSKMTGYEQLLTGYFGANIDIGGQSVNIGPILSDSVV